MEIERRTIPTELRAETREDSNAFTTTGYAATYNEPYDLGLFVEQIDARAFDGQTDNPQIRGLWNHDSSNVLGRVPGTVRLSSDERGLLAEIDFPQSAVREREAVERGDVDRMSFGFRTLEDRWEEMDDGRELRTIVAAELFDVSPVAFPANPNTDLGVAKRSLDAWRTEHEEAKDDTEEERRERELELMRRK